MCLLFVQDASILYFLHGESYNTLKLPRLVANETPTVTHVIAKVIEKEYCVARKVRYYFLILTK